MVKHTHVTMATGIPGCLLLRPNRKLGSVASLIPLHSGSPGSFYPDPSNSRQDVGACLCVGWFFFFLMFIGVLSVSVSVWGCQRFWNWSHWIYKQMWADMCTGNWTWVLWKSSQCSWPLRHLSSPMTYYFPLKVSFFCFPCWTKTLELNSSSCLCLLSNWN